MAGCGGQGTVPLIPSPSAPTFHRSLLTTHIAKYCEPPP